MERAPSALASKRMNAAAASARAASLVMRDPVCGIHHRLSMTTSVKFESALSAAMASGLTDQVWTIEDMRAMLHGSEPTYPVLAGPAASELDWQELRNLRAAPPVVARAS